MTLDIRTVVFGSSRIREDHPAWNLAYETGRLLAERGRIVVSGGYEGSMGAVSRGACDAGGRVIGIGTGTFGDRVPNPALHEFYTEPDYLSREATLIRHGHEFVVLGGGLGTLSEWVTAWCLASIGQLGGPLYVFEDPWKELGTGIAALAEVADEFAGLVHWIRTPEDLAAAIDRNGDA